jgi:hypothetical protein
VLRARPKRMLFGTFFDVPNLTEVATRFADLPRGFGYPASRVEKLASRPTTVGDSPDMRSATSAPMGTRFHGSLEEDIEAQEEPGQRRPATVVDVTEIDSTETASKVTTSQEGEHQGGQGAR